MCSETIFEGPREGDIIEYCKKNEVEMNSYALVFKLCKPAKRFTDLEYKICNHMDSVSLLAFILLGNCTYVSKPSFPHL